MPGNINPLVSAVAGLIIAAVLAVPGPAQALEPFAPKESEAHVLPEYCQVKLFGDKIVRSKTDWGKFFGPEWLHMHHFCYALNFINRAKNTRSQTDRQYYLREAEDNIKYVMDRTTDKYVLAPEFYLNMGEIWLLRGDKAQAESNYRKAASIRPDYPKGWLALSDLYRQTDRPDQARGAIESALKASPDKYKDYLRKRLAELEAESKTSEQQSAPEKPQGK